MLALFVIGLFGLLLLHAARLTHLIRENVQIQVYLNKNISEAESIRISQLLSQKDFVRHVSFTSREEVAQDFIQATGENLLEVLDENPLRDVYIVSIAPTHQGGAQLQAIRQELEALNGVFEVDYVADFVASVNRNLTRVGAVLGAFALVLLVAVVVLINNTIRLALYSQRFLIRSMNLVGATAAFIRKPFLARAVVIGLLASTLAGLLLLLLLHYANGQVEALVKLQDPLRIFALLAAIFVLGLLISVAGTYRAVNKYLRMSLDDLY